jgi:hypothetical protein
VPQSAMVSVLDQFHGISQTIGMFWNFFDEAGGADHNFIAACGWLAEREKWREFKIQSKAMLESCGVPHFHKKEIS